MRPPRILLVSNVDARFVENDRTGLEDIGEVIFLQYQRRMDFVKLACVLPWSDVVVCWFVLGYATAGVILSGVFGIPCVLIAGGWDVSADADLGYGAMLDAWRVRKTRYALRHASRVIAVSEHTRHEVERWVSRPVDVIPNGVDTDFFQPSSEPAKQVLTVAGVDSKVRFRVKGVDVFLEVAREIPEVPFLLVGGNTCEWDRVIRETAPANVRILGHVGAAELRELYRSSQVYAQLSAHESFGVALAEAMACGCVPVVSSRGALPEVVGSVGQVVEYGDVRSAEDAVRRALDDTDGRKRARERIVNQFSLDRRRVELASAVRSLLDGGR